MSSTTDRWAEWLRTRRDGGSVEERRRTLEWLAPIRDKILDDAAVRPGDTLLDVGCGDGLVGLGALDRGADVIFSDVSQPCLDDCRALAGDAARYHRAPATDLGVIEADIVTTRSVLIYVADKERAFAEFHRVLRPGGRLSIFEPINRFGMEERRRSYGGYDVSGIEPLLERVAAASDRADRVGETDPMIDFDERDLFELAERAGFAEVRVELHAELKQEPMTRTRDWEVFLASSPNPLAPTFGEALVEALNDGERARVVAQLRPQVERGEGVTRFARAFLLARKA